LKERTDRYRALVRELRRLRIAVTDDKVHIPDTPRPEDANGFPTKGVYGNFLSHLDILKSAEHDNLRSVLVLEDDAIFSHRFAREQFKAADFLARNQWDICHFGHTLTKELASLERGLPRYSGDFYWAHCYAVHARILPRLIKFLQETIERPAGHPRGGKMYIDGAYTLFRKFNPEVVTLVSNPVASLQRGSLSNLANAPRYSRYPLLRKPVELARVVRDEYWRCTGLGGTARGNPDA
jgi:glycosyl transferase, family 25